MIAYTAWDGLRLIAAEFDAELSVASDRGVGFAPRCSRLVSVVKGRATSRLAPAVAALLAAVASSAG